MLFHSLAVITRVVRRKERKALWSEEKKERHYGQKKRKRGHYGQKKKGHFGQRKEKARYYGQRKRHYDHGTRERTICTVRGKLEEESDSSARTKEPYLRNKTIELRQQKKP
jgi:hypothetical protein